MGLRMLYLYAFPCEVAYDIHTNLSHGSLCTIHIALYCLNLGDLLIYLLSKDDFISVMCTV